MTSHKKVQAALILFLIVGFCLFMLRGPSHLGRSNRAACAYNLRQIGIALTTYADQHGGLFPPEIGAKGLNHLLSEHIFVGTNAAKAFVCPYDKTRQPARFGAPLTEDTCSYAYVPTALGSATETNLLPVCWDKLGNHGTIEMNVLFNDGHVAFVTMERWEKIRPRTPSEVGPSP